MDFNPPRRDFILQMRKVNYTDAQLVKIWRINDYRVPNPSWDIYNVTTTPKAKGKNIRRWKDFNSQTGWSSRHDGEAALEI